MILFPIVQLLQSIHTQNNTLEKFNSDEPQYDGIKSFYLLMNGYNANYYYRWQVTDYIVLALFYLIAFLISAGAAYLSYSCTWGGTMRNQFLRVVTAFFAFMLGPIYLIWYFFVNYLGGLC